MQPFKKIIFIGTALLLIAVLFTTAQADYLGPNRVIVTYETQYHRVRCNYVAVSDPPGSSPTPDYCSCNYTVFVGYGGSCPGIDLGLFNFDTCNWTSACRTTGITSTSSSSSTESCNLRDSACTAHVIEHRTTLAAATISGAITCSTPGQNGWCVGPAVLNASGSEPLSGYSILTLEGTRNGESFACPGASCSNVPLSEGSNDFQFWAISSYGDSSAMGSASASVDTQAPTISGSLSGTQGENGWYTSAVTLNAAATDPAPGSGIASFEVSADGAAWQPCSGSLTLGDGVHTVSLRTADAAGWTASAEQTFSVDTQPPQLSADLSGNLVSPGRYNTSVTLSASGSDTGSGLNRIEYQDNAGGWTVYTAPLVFYNGQHAIEVRAVDQAGLTSDVQTFSFFVESRGPYITVPDHWQVGQTISVSVQANSFSLGSVSIVVSDPQKRWPDVEQVYPASGDSFTTDFHWDGQFNRQTAAAGQYTVSVYASDVMSNLSVSHSQVTIPVVIPTAVPTLTATGTVAAAAAESTTAAAATATPQPSSTPTTVAGVPVTSFSSPASPATQPVATLPSNVLWGGAAAAVIGAAVVETTRKRKGEEEAKPQHGGGKPLNLLVEDSLASENESPHGAAQPAAKAKKPATIITAQNEETENSGFLDEFEKQALDTATDTDSLLTDRLEKILMIVSTDKGGSSKQYLIEAFYYIKKYGWNPDRLEKYLEEVIIPRELKEQAGLSLTLGENARKDANQIIDELKELIVSNSQSKVEQLEQSLQKLNESSANLSEDEVNALRKEIQTQINQEKIIQRIYPLEEFGEKLSRGSLISGSVSILSGLISLVTGSREAKTVGDVANVVSGAFDAADLAKRVYVLINGIESVEHVASPALTVAGKILGPLSIVLGAMSMWNGVTEIRKSPDTKLKVAGGFDFVLGALTFAAGVCLLIPAAQPAAVVLFTISGAVYAGKIVYENWDSITATSAKIVNWVFDGAADLGIQAKGFITTTAAEAVTSTATTMATVVKNGTATAAKVVTTAARATVTAVKNAAAATAKAVTSAAKAAVTAVKSAATMVAKVVTSAAKTAVTAVKNAATTVAKAVTSAAKTAVTAVKNAATTVAKAVTSTAKTAVKAVKSAATATAKAVTSATKTAVTTVKNAAATTVKNIGAALHNIFKK